MSKELSFGIGVLCGFVACVLLWCICDYKPASTKTAWTFKADTLKKRLFVHVQPEEKKSCYCYCGSYQDHCNNWEKRGPIMQFDCPAPKPAETIQMMLKRQTP